jgi:hypothetical protein
MQPKTAIGPQFAATSSYLVEQLRESLPFLKEEGWTNTAELVNAAASELERLALKVRDLEGQIGDADQVNTETFKQARVVSRFFS